MNRWVREISWLLAIVLACDGVLGALAHSHACPNHSHATVGIAAHDDSHRADAYHGCDCDHAVVLAKSADSNSEPASPHTPNDPDDGCAACRYLAQSGVLHFAPNIGSATECVAGFVPPVVAPVESNVLRVHYSRGPPASC